LISYLPMVFGAIILKYNNAKDATQAGYDAE